MTTTAKQAPNPLIAYVVTRNLADASDCGREAIRQSRLGDAHAAGYFAKLAASYGFAARYAESTTHPATA